MTSLSNLRQESVWMDKLFQNTNQWFKVTLQRALMSMESWFSEILPSRSLLIALEQMEQIGLSKFGKKYGTTHIHRNRKTITQNYLLSRLWRRHISKYFTSFRRTSIELFCQHMIMLMDTHAKFEVKSLANFLAMKFKSLIAYSTTNARKTG